MLSYKNTQNNLSNNISIIFLHKQTTFEEIIFGIFIGTSNLKWIIVLYLRILETIYLIKRQNFDVP